VHVSMLRPLMGANVGDRYSESARKTVARGSRGSNPREITEWGRIVRLMNLRVLGQVEVLARLYDKG
jgi:hypothetical protein